MRERGKYQIQLMKTRSSSGVGQKIDLDFDIDTLRITNSEEQSDESSGSGETRSSTIMNSIKRNSVVDPTTGEITAQDPTQGMVVKTSQVRVESTKLRQLLNNIDDI
jgi:hypothetical protein